MVRAALCFAMIMALQAGNAIACLGSFDERATLLHSLPEGANEKEVVAKAKVLVFEEVKNRNAKLTDAHNGLGEDVKIIHGDDGYYVGLEVLEAIKGIEKGQAILAFINNNSCSRDVPPVKGQEVYIAGEIKNDVFEGEWVGETDSFSPLQ